MDQLSESLNALYLNNQPQHNHQLNRQPQQPQQFYLNQQHQSNYYPTISQNQNQNQNQPQPKNLIKTTGNNNNNNTTPRALTNYEPIKPKEQHFHSFLCLDVESTCIDTSDPKSLENPLNLTDSQLKWLYPNEIIEWPAILLQWRFNNQHDRPGWELVEVDRYRAFVKPSWRNKVTEFCTDLTGITQEQVDSAMSFPEVIKDFDKNFIKPHGLFTNTNRTVWVTDGPWDFRDHFLKSIFLAKIQKNNLPHYLRSPISIIDTRYLIKIFVQRFFNDDPQRSKVQVQFFGLNEILNFFGLEFEGQSHSGIDDAFNISRLLMRLVEISRSNKKINDKQNNSHHNNNFNNNFDQNPDRSQPKYGNPDSNHRIHEPYHQHQHHQQQQQRRDQESLKENGRLGSNYQTSDQINDDEFQLRWTFKPNRFIELIDQRFFWMGKGNKCTWTSP